jgi:hypothetical protein
LAALGASLVSARAEDTAVAVDNRSAATTCAEEDNVYLRFRSPGVRRFRIEARQPAYIGTVAADRTAPDFTGCKPPSAAPSGPTFTPRRQVLFESSDWRLVGFTFERFWRADSVPVRVGDHVARGIHLLQLWTRYDGGTEEVLVLYPTDGYWRARPLPSADLGTSSYGSSFLIGPVEVKERPFVDIREVAFDPATRTFRLSYARGGSGTLRLEAVDRERVVLSVIFDGAVRRDLPFAALRSMFIAADDADAAEVRWRTSTPAAWRTAPILSFGGASVTALWAQRTTPSRHNTSAPDMGFNGFSKE